MKVIKKAKTDVKTLKKASERVHSECDHIKCKLCPPMKE